MPDATLYQNTQYLIPAPMAAAAAITRCSKNYIISRAFAKNVTWKGSISVRYSQWAKIP
jgi:hypothetical protein